MRSLGTGRSGRRRGSTSSGRRPQTPGPSSRSPPSGSCPCCSARRPCTPASRPEGGQSVRGWSGSRQESGWDGTRWSGRSTPVRRRASPASPRSPGRSRGTRCRRTCGPAPARYRRWIPSCRSGSRRGRDRSRPCPGRRPRPRSCSGCGCWSSQRSAQRFCRAARRGRCAPSSFA